MGINNHDHQDHYDDHDHDRHHHHHHDHLDRQGHQDGQDYPERQGRQDPDHHHGADQRAAVRSAEQTVSDAWIGQLLLAEHEAHLTVDVCTRVRERLADRLRVARQVGDPPAIQETARRLDRADHACAVALDTYSESRDLLAEQLENWLRATRMRFREAQDDRRVIGW